MPNKLIFNGFKKFTNLLSYNNLNYLYVKSINHYDRVLNIDDLKLESIKCNFTTGTSTLNTYRVLKVNNEKVFEKVYKINSEDLRRTEYFYKNYSNLFYPNANLNFHRKGHKLKALYFEFVESKTKDQDFLKASILFTINSLNKTLKQKQCTVLQENDQYHQSIKCSKEFFSERQFNTLNAIEQFTSKYIIFSHGDITIESSENKNLIEGKLIDFDRSGYYPFGFDVGRTLSSYIKINNTEKIDEAINELSDKIGHKISYNIIKLSVYYFSVLFILRKFILFPTENNFNENFIQKLYTILENTYISETKVR